MSEMPAENFSEGREMREKHVVIEAEENFMITCGKSVFSLDKHGNIIIAGVNVILNNVNIEASHGVTINGNEIDLRAIKQTHITGSNIGRN